MKLRSKLHMEPYLLNKYYGGSQSQIKSGVRLPGTAGNYISTPDSVENSVTGDIDIRVFAKLDDWSPAANQTLIAKWSGSPNRSYLVRVNTLGGLRLEWSQDGTNGLSAVSTAAVSAADGTALWCRVVLDVDNGAGGRDVKFYTSVDGVTWTQLGSTVTTAGVTNVSDGAAPVELGSNTTGTGDLLAGTIYYAEVRNGIDGPMVARFDSSTISVSGAQTPATINGWTWNGSALYKRDDYVRLPGTSGNYLSYPDTVANSVTGDIDIRAHLSMDDWTPAADTYILSKEVPTTTRSYCLGVKAAGAIELRFSLDGSTVLGQFSSVANSFVDGSVNWIRATRQASSGNCNFYTSPDGVTWTLLGTADRGSTAGAIADTTAGLELGSRAGGGSNLWAGNLYYAEVRNGIAGTVVASFDARVASTPWTINGSAWNWEGSSFVGKPAIALSLDGTVGNYVQTPDTAGTSIVGDIDLRAKIAPISWTPSVIGQIIDKRAGPSQNSYQFRLDPAGTVTWAWSSDGTNTNFQSSSALTGVTNGVAKWVRVTFVVATGISKHYVSDDGAVWTPVSTSGTFGATSIFDSTTAVTVGANGSGTQPLNGKIFYAEVRNGIDGPIVAMFDPVRMAKTGTRTPASTVQPGGTPNMLTPNQASIETDASGWSANTSSPTLARDLTQFLDGVASLSLTATVAGPTTMSAYTTIAVVPVVPGKLYTARASFRSAVTGRTAHAKIDFFTGTTLGTFISGVASGGVSDTTAGWTPDVINAVAPALSNFAAVEIIIDGVVSGEVHYADRISLVEAAATWTINGSAWDLIAA